MTEKYKLTTRKSFLVGITSDDTLYDVQFSNVQIVKLLNRYVKENQRLKEQKSIYKRDWKHLCMDKELLEEEIEQLKEETNYLKHALRRLVENFDDEISKSSPVRELII